MRSHLRLWPVTIVCSVVCSAIALSAHVTPPRILMTELEALQRLFPGAGEPPAQQIRLTSESRQQIYKQFDWKPDAKYRVFPVGAGGGSGALFVLIDYTLHGPVRTAVAIDRQGRVKGAQILELQEEAYVWVKPIIDADFAKPWIGRDCQRGTKPPASAGQGGENMIRFYRAIIEGQLCHAAALYRFGMQGGRT